jgi:copper transport protein
MSTLELLTRSNLVVGYLATAVLIGGLVFLSFLWPAGAAERRTHRLLATSVLAGLGSSVVAAALFLERVTGEVTLDGVLHGPLAEDHGRPYAALALLWLLAGVVVVAVLQGGADVVRRLPWRVGALAVAVGLLRTRGLNAHAAESGQPFWGAVADFLHLAGVSAWVGGLTLMLVCLLPGRSLAELHQVVPRFSRVALGSVLMIVSSGLILLWQIVAPLDGFWSSDYSRVLVVKFVLFGAVMLAAMNSKRWVEKTLAKAVASHRTGAARFFAASVAAESALAVAVLGAASVLTTSSPGV